MALKSMGVVKNYDRVRDFSVAVVGIGGVGVGVVEMLTRCGVGKIIIYDYDTIELANMNKCAPALRAAHAARALRFSPPFLPSFPPFPSSPPAARVLRLSRDSGCAALTVEWPGALNRMFYRPEQSGWNKTMACRHYCSELNPDVVFEVHNMDITAAENRAKFKVCARRVRIDVSCARVEGDGNAASSTHQPGRALAGHGRHGLRRPQREGEPSGRLCGQHGGPGVPRDGQ